MEFTAALEASGLSAPVENDGQRHRPIGVFDSGVGGLTVVNALRRLLPSEDIFYLGDNARIPYGNKGAATVERYSFELTGLLLAEGAKAIVVACNTATALALPRLQDALRVPVVGVIAPGAAAAVAATRNGPGRCDRHACDDQQRSLRTGAAEIVSRTGNPRGGVPAFRPIDRRGLAG